MSTQLLTQGKALFLSAALVGASLASLPAVAVEAGYGNNVEKQQLYKKNAQQKKHFKRMVKVLNLTEDQQAKIKAIREGAKEQQQANREAMKAFRTAKIAIAKADTLDGQALLDLYAENNDAFAQKALTRIKTRQAISAVLTEEQRVKWQKFHKRMAKKGKKGKNCNKGNRVPKAQRS